MVKSCFFAIGMFATLCGVSLLFVDKVVLNGNEEPQTESAISSMFSSVTPEQQKVIDPPEWAAFSLMSVGAVTMLYSVALPKKRE
jgi:hypothetical protein